MIVTGSYPSEWVTSAELRERPLVAFSRHSDTTYAKGPVSVALDDEESPSLPHPLSVRARGNPSNLRKPEAVIGRTLVGFPGFCDTGPSS
jgi:hypothetical protein